MPAPFIMVAPNGARRTKADHPAVPITMDQIVADAIECHAAGADALHLHVRDRHGRHSLDPVRYRETLDALTHAVPRMRVQITTESAGVFDVPAQLACLENLVPGWASVSVREIAQAPDLAERLYHGCAARGTDVQHILYDHHDLAQLRRWQSAGVVPPDQSSAIFVLGRYATGKAAAVADLDPFLAHWRGADDPWMACAFGHQEHICLAAAAKRGGQIRVGFENSLTDPDGTPHASNAASVAAVAKLLESVKDPV